MRNKWYDYYARRVEEIIKKYKKKDTDIIMYKEKFGRFDMTAFVYNSNMRDELEYLEEESEHRCMDCAKLRKQIWFRQWWWYQHTCFRCYLKHLPKIIRRWMREKLN